MKENKVMLIAVCGILVVLVLMMLTIVAMDMNSNNNDRQVKIECIKTGKEWRDGECVTAH